MRETTVKIYKFSELSDDAKERARNWYREGNEYGWFGECEDSLKGFASALPIKITDYQYGEDRSRSRIRFEITDDAVTKLKGLRLRTWLINKFWNEIEKGKYYSTSGTYDAEGKYHYKKRHSSTTKEVSCPFTGVCFDENLLDPIREFIFKYAAKDSETTFEDLIRASFDSFMSAIADDIEYQNEDAQVEESIKANEYEFTEDGERA